MLTGWNHIQQNSYYLLRMHCGDMTEQHLDCDMQEKGAYGTIEWLRLRPSMQSDQSICCSHTVSADPSGTTFIICFDEDW